MFIYDLTRRMSTSDLFAASALRCVRRVLDEAGGLAHRQFSRRALIIYIVISNDNITFGRGMRGSLMGPVGRVIIDRLYAASLVRCVGLNSITTL